MPNHIIDPTYFWDAVEEFAFNYQAFIVNKDGVDDYGNTKLTYTETVVRGSLQTKGLSISQKTSGNTNEMNYEFYCMSTYRLNIGDIIQYKNNYLRVNSMHEYDEYGVRTCELAMIQLTAYRDFAEYLKYRNGTEIV